jgi:Cys-rich repeat protein
MSNEGCDSTTGRCVAVGPQGGACTMDADCPAGQLCDVGAGGVCVGGGLGCRGAVEYPNCLTDADCPAGVVCNTDAGECRGVRCTSDRQCLAGQSCQSGVCATGGCSVASARDARAEAGGLAWLMMVAWLLLTTRRRRARLQVCG